MSSDGAPPEARDAAGETDLEFEIGAADDGRRLDLIASEYLPDISRSEAARWVEAGFVLLDGRVRRPGHRCRTGQRVVVAAPGDGSTPRFGAPGENDPLSPEPVPLEVLHEDPCLVVIDKPAGLVVHPGPGHRQGTLANGLIHRYPEIARVGSPGRPGLVHRLDRGTSGVLVAARTEPARLRLTAAFAERQVQKQYLALVMGRFGEHRRIEEPIGRDPKHGQRYRCRGRYARDAETEAWPLEELPLTTFVGIRLHTGRTHQARVHLSHTGHPIAGDVMYGPGAPRRGGGQAGAALRRLERPALHAAEIAFAHPGTGEPVRFAAPLAEDLQRTLMALRSATA
ncbi:MAG: RluA family pseudouridine synthase [Acidobacteriota bacterium]|nr:RluA family pseudouridine synthase [Acidobacteriota bacterium]MDE2711586.1 RluA family pseudouridine synthase [Acidobacteriota bacterium]